MNTTRQWAALYSGMLRHPKYRRLSAPGRAGLLHLLLLAGTVSPEATWRIDELVEILELDGFSEGGALSVSAHDVLDELERLGWLDRDDPETLTIHNWDKWQFACSREVAAAWEASRKREWRLKTKANEATARAQDNKGQDNKRHNTSPGSPGSVRDVSGTSPGRGQVVPSAGPCRVCSEPMTDKDPGAKVGPGSIQHGAH
jgi:hypothetical protein